MLRDNEHETSYHINADKKKSCGLKEYGKKKYRKIIFDEIKNFLKDFGYKKKINFFN